MKIKTILEARYRAPKKKHPTLDELGADFPNMPTSKIKGDFAWHLEKFWQIDGNTHWRSKRNPKFSKAAKEALNHALDELAEKDHPSWDEVDRTKLYKNLINNVYAFGLFREVEEAKFKEMPGYPWENNTRGFNNEYYDNQDKIEKAVEKQWKDHWKYYQDNLPLKETPVAKVVDFAPVADLVCFLESDHITSFKVVWNKKGEITRVFGHPNPYDNTPWNLTGFFEGRGSTPRGLEKTLHYYKRHHHSEWSK